MDPLARPDPQPPRGTLFDSTSRLAGEAAARNSGKRRAQILQVLRDRGPLAIFEIAAQIGCLDHQISGRFGELERDGLIQKTGQRVTKPDTGQPCERYALASLPTAHCPLPTALGYPSEFRLDDGLYHLVAQDVAAAGNLPGFEYLKFTQGEVPRLSLRASLILCPACGSPLRQSSSSPPNCPTPKLFTCGTDACPGAKGYEVRLVAPAGQPSHIALLLRHF
jgi:DNA-binding HxlR family transcriptional regulator